MTEPFANKSPFQYRLRTLMFVFVVLSFLGGLLLTPIAKINEATCDRIVPGMSLEEVGAIIGQPPGHYDGAVSIVTNAPRFSKSETHWERRWVGSKGEILFDHRGTFYPALEVQSRDYYLFVLERITRHHNGELTFAECAFASICLTIAVTFFISRLSKIEQSENSLTRHGVVGLIVGFCVSLFCWLTFLSERERENALQDTLFASLPLFILIGAVGGSIFGLLIGTLRCWIRQRRQRTAATNKPAGGLQPET